MKCTNTHYKIIELVNIMVKRKINNLYLKETKWVVKKVKIIGIDLGFKLYYTGKYKIRNRIRIIVDSF